MRIAAIGNYNSEKYKELLLATSVIFPEDNVMDLSAPVAGDFKMRQAWRFSQIKSASLFVFDQNYKESPEILQDITYAQCCGLDGYLYSGGTFRSHPCHQ